jgi:hypothetical protein
MPGADDGSHAAEPAGKLARRFARLGETLAVQGGMIEGRKAIFSVLSSGNVDSAIHFDCPRPALWFMRCRER